MVDAPPDAAASALLAGILQDCGQLGAAQRAAQEAVSAASTPALRVLALDVQTGVWLTLGDVESARAGVEQLAATPLPAARLAAAFRQARLHRLDGMLAQAVGLLGSVWSGLPVADRRFAAPRAAALQEVAEYELLAGHLEEARSALQRAQACWERSGRRPGAFAAEGLRLRLQLAAGELPLPSAVDNGVAFGESRGLELLSAELRVARGRARAAGDIGGAAEDFDHAVAVGQRTGARLLEGRARLWRRVAGCAAEPGDRERARLLLSADRVLGRHPALWGQDPVP